MPLPESLARFNRHVTNRIARPLTAHLPPFANVVHRGRASGRVYRTPVMFFRRDRDVVIALTYGSDADWVANVLAAGGCEIEHAGRRFRFASPRIVDLPAVRRVVPGPVAAVLTLLDVDEFLRLSPVGARGT